MPISDFKQKAGAYLDNPPPTVATYDSALRSVNTDEEVGSFWNTVGTFGKELGKAIIKPAQNLGEDIAHVMYKDEFQAARDAVDRMRASDPELAKQLDMEIGEDPTLKRWVGDIAGTALTAASFIPGVGIFSLGSKAKTVMVAGQALKAGSVAEKLLLTSKAAPFIRASIEGGMWMGGFTGAEATAENKDTGEILKETGLGTMAGMVAAPLLHGSISLVGAGFSKTASIKPVQNLWGKLAESEPAKFLNRFFSRTGSILSNDFNLANVAEGIKNADRNTQLGMARILDVFGNDVPFKVNKKTLEGAQAAYEFGRGKYPTNLSLTTEMKAEAGALSAEQQTIAQTAAQKSLMDGGVTISLDGKIATKGYAVSPYKELEAVVPEETFRANPAQAALDYAKKNLNVIKQPDHNIGIWVDQDTKQVFLDVSVTKADKNTALQFAADNKQIAIYDLENLSAINVKPLETGRVTGLLTKTPEGVKVGMAEAGAVKGALPEDIAQAGIKERWDAFYNDFAETARALKLNVRSVDFETGKVSYKPFPKVEEIAADYRPKVGIDIQRLGKDANYRKFAIQQMVDDSLEGKSKWNFKTIQDAENWVNEYVDFVERNGVGVKKDSALVKGMMASGQAADENEALRLLNNYRTNLSKVKLGTYLEHERQIDFPLYNPYPDETMTVYAMDSLKRIELINQFGYKLSNANKVSYPVIDKAIEQVRNAVGRGSDEFTAFNKFLNVALERVAKGTPEEKFSTFLRVTSVPKLTFSQIVNSGQGILNTLLTTDTPTVLKGLVRSFSHVGQKEAMQSGANMQSLINEVLRPAVGGQYATSWLKATGYVFTEWWNRTVSANVFKYWTEKQFAKVLKNPENKIAGAYLKELGVNVEKAVTRGKLTDYELLKAMQIGAEKTQFRSRPIDLPYWSSSPAGKLFWQFKNYGYQQTNLIKDELTREIRLGNYGRVARMILILGTVFPMGGEVLQDVRSLITQSKRPTKFLDRYFSDLVSAGSLGIIGDVIQSADYGTLEASAPSLSTISNIGTAVISDWNNPAAVAKAFLKETGVAAPVLNVMKKKQKGKESMLQTIEKLMTE